MKKRIVIFQTTDQFVKEIENLIKQGVYRSKTEALNDAIRHLVDYINNSKVKKK